MLPKPHISQPYNSLGLMTLLNRSNCISSGKLRILILRSREKTAIFAWSVMCYFARVKESLRPRNTPKYLYSFTISNSLPYKINLRFLGSLPPENTTSLDSLMCTVSSTRCNIFQKRLMLIANLLCCFQILLCRLQITGQADLYKCKHLLRLLHI